MLWRVYLDSYKGDFRDAQLSQAMIELHKMLEFSVGQQKVSAAQQGAPADAKERRG
jgi:hypothetical protein